MICRQVLARFGNNIYTAVNTAPIVRGLDAGIISTQFYCRRWLAQDEHDQCLNMRMFGKEELKEFINKLHPEWCIPYRPIVTSMVNGIVHSF